MRIAIWAAVGVAAVAVGSCAMRQEATPSRPASLPTDTRGLRNLHRLGDRIISGSVPEGDTGFADLQAMGVRTIISVDGAGPDVEGARRRGLRYVHIPVTYADITEEQRLQIARAIRDLPGPVYIHCHHGKHRSPAATAAAAIALGLITPEQGVAFMREAGTAPNYTGLYACVAQAVAVSAAALDATPPDFPDKRGPQGLVASMVHADEAFEHLSAIRAAGWAVPADQPDLVPASEAGQLADHLRFAKQDRDAAAHGGDFLSRLDHAVAVATALEDAFVKGVAASELECTWTLLAASCTDCHAQYRDVRK